MLLKAKAAVGIGMALHELAANAAAGGALSVPQGRVRIDWSVEQADTPEARLLTRWRETGGPPPREPELARYGSRFIVTTLNETIGASGSIGIEDGAVAVCLALPLSTGLVVTARPAGPKTGNNLIRLGTPGATD